jgi:hypothetical protein
VLCLFSPDAAFAKQAATSADDLVNLPHVAVPSPTEFLNQLLSPDSQVRIKALQLVGVSKLFLMQKTATGEDYTISSQARLLYGRYLQDRDLAVIVLQMHDTDWASVLLRDSSGWERIGILNCWCRYDSNPLEAFVGLRSIAQQPQTQILVHESGGGTGLYDRTLTVFALRNGKLKTIYGTRDRTIDCHPTQNKDYCTLTEAQMESTSLFGQPVLAVARVESIAPIPSLPQSDPRFGSAPELLVYKGVRRIDCKVFSWDTAEGSFVESLRWTHAYCGAPETTKTQPKR